MQFFYFAEGDDDDDEAAHCQNCAHWLRKPGSELGTCQHPEAIVPEPFRLCCCDRFIGTEFF